MYFASPGSIKGTLRPFTWYKRFVVEGAKQHDLPAEYIQALERVEAIDDPNKNRDRRERAILCSGKLKAAVPPRVIPPGPPTDFIPVADHPETNRAGLGYAILRALGAHEGLPAPSLAVISRWSSDYGAAHGDVTPNESNLDGSTFADRVGTRFNADKAVRNACCYQGGRGGRPSYEVIYREVWIDQKWPELCKALAGR